LTYILPQITQSNKHRVSQSFRTAFFDKLIDMEYFQCNHIFSTWGHSRQVKDKIFYLSSINELQPPRLPIAGRHPS